MRVKKEFFSMKVNMSGLEKLHNGWQLKEKLWSSGKQGQEKYLFKSRYVLYLVTLSCRGLTPLNKDETGI